MTEDETAPPRKPTAAGRRLIARFLLKEAAGRLATYGSEGNVVARGITLTSGDGGELASASKLERDGLAKLYGGYSNAERLLALTEAGRACMERETGI